MKILKEILNELKEINKKLDFLIKEEQPKKKEKLLEKYLNNDKK